MRKHEKKITDKAEILAIIKESKVCRLAMVDGNKPYIVPLSFGIQDNELYVHGASKGKKIDIITNNPNVCFEFDILFKPIESEKGCNWSMKYKSVIGFGKATLLDDLSEKQKALHIIMAQYSDQQFDFPEKTVKNTAVIKIEIDSLTGKQSPADQ